MGPALEPRLSGSRGFAVHRLLCLLIGDAFTALFLPLALGARVSGILTECLLGEGRGEPWLDLGWRRGRASSTGALCPRDVVVGLALRGDASVGSRVCSLA